MGRSTVIASGVSIASRVAKTMPGEMVVTGIVSVVPAVHDVGSAVVTGIAAKIGAVASVVGPVVATGVADVVIVGDHATAQEQGAQGGPCEQHSLIRFHGIGNRGFARAAEQVILG